MFQFPNVFYQINFNVITIDGQTRLAVTTKSIYVILPEKCNKYTSTANIIMNNMYNTYKYVIPRHNN